MLVGSVTVVYGVTVAVDGDELGATTGRAALSGVALSAGAVRLARAVFDLLGPVDEDHERLERFRREIAAGGADGETLARFEGELAAAAAGARGERIASGVSSFAFAAGGGALLAFGASDALEGSAESAAYVFGGTLLGLGLLQGAASMLVPSPQERIWNRYQGLRMADTSTLIRISVAPVVAPGLAGVGVSGRF
jgi:hypothetical protein